MKVANTSYNSILCSIYIVCWGLSESFLVNYSTQDHYCYIFVKHRIKRNRICCLILIRQNNTYNAIKYKSGFSIVCIRHLYEKKTLLLNRKNDFQLRLWYPTQLHLSNLRFYYYYISVVYLTWNTLMYMEIYGRICWS